MKKLMTIGAALVFAAVFTGCPNSPSNSSSGVATTVDRQLVSAPSLYEKIGDNVYRCTIKDPACVNSHKNGFYYTPFDPEDYTKNGVTYSNSRIHPSIIKVRKISGGSENTIAGFALLATSKLYISSEGNNNWLIVMKNLEPDGLHVYDVEGYSYHISWPSGVSDNNIYKETDFDLDNDNTKGFDTDDELTVYNSYINAYNSGYLAGNGVPSNSIHLHNYLEGYKWGFVVIPDPSDVVSEDNPLVVEFTLEDY